MQTLIITLKNVMKTINMVTEKMEKTIVTVVHMLEEFILDMASLAASIAPDSNHQIAEDFYCRGMIFGLNGSKMLVNIANIIMREAPDYKNKSGGKDVFKDTLN